MNHLVEGMLEKTRNYNRDYCKQSNFVVIFDENDQSGKHSLAIDTIEYFLTEDLLTTLPKSGFDTKIFVNYYVSITILFFILIANRDSNISDCNGKKKNKTSIRKKSYFTYLAIPLSWTSNHSA